VGTVQARNLYAATILLGIYSLLMALTWTLLHAVDVAFTEAAVGAGVVTVLMVYKLQFQTPFQTDYDFHLSLSDSVKIYLERKRRNPLFDHKRYYSRI